MLRRGLALLALAAMVACSYSLELPACKVSCSGPADCPSDSTCRSGFCQRGSLDQCAGSTGGSAGADAAASTGGAPGTGGASVNTGGATMNTGGAPASTGGAPGTGGGPMPPPPDSGAPSACGQCGMGTICCMPPWGCQGMCIPDCRPTGMCQGNDVCNTVTGLCQPDCRRLNNNCPPGSGLTCNTSNGVCR